MSYILHLTTEGRNYYVVVEKVIAQWVYNRLRAKLNKQEVIEKMKERAEKVLFACLVVLALGSFGFSIYYRAKKQVKGIAYDAPAQIATEKTKKEKKQKKKEQKISKPIPMKLISGTIPLIASVTYPSSCTDTKETIYDFGSLYNVTAFSFSYAASATNNCAVDIYAEDFSLYLSTDNINYKTVFGGSGDCIGGSEFSNPISIVPTRARYGKWQTSIEYNPYSANGTIRLVLSNPRLRGILIKKTCK
ncbi:MAG: hypothetical protein CEN89_586 [Candidatus Berkelbacteria bacterium Licking1014_7]|uniref:Uncharacterized protein n=1 Tax=Candidatus Berkelbacteria bacterium Licking1014_7 TaxID=2017147 RepID=A0A554LIE8_9BACT|nr:MAG: hypothetical protein CEN89_586 [Candidatus Berkelbacteria bacterium Licking1014_7]